MDAGDLAKRVVGRLATWPPVAGRTRRLLASSAAILYAHEVGEPTPHCAAFYYGFTPDTLHARLGKLRRWFQFAPLAEVLAHNGGDRELAPPLLAITFDDGFDMTRNGVLDILAAHGVSATAFVLTSTVDNANLMWRNKLSAILALRPAERCLASYNDLMARVGQPAVSDRAALLSGSLGWDPGRKDELADELWTACDMPPLEEYLDEHRPYFTWQGIQTWLDRGHAVGFHTHTHPVCSRLSDELVLSEIVEPAAALRARLGTEAMSFSYPFGARLAPAAEESMRARGTFDCMLGTRGLSLRGTPPNRLERASLEGDLAFQVWGKTLVRHYRRILRP